MLLAEKWATIVKQQELKIKADNSDVVTYKRYLTTNISHLCYANFMSNLRAQEGGSI